MTETAFCIFCGGRMLNPGARFCKSCGRPLTPRPRPPESAEEPAAAPPAIPVRAPAEARPPDPPPAPQATRVNPGLNSGSKVRIVTPPRPPEPGASGTPEWYFTFEGDEYGPISEPDLRARLKRAELPPDLPMRRNESETWRTAVEAGLADAPRPAQPGIAWYYAAAGQPVGPVNEDSLRKWLREGRLTPDAQVWHAGLAKWQSARDAGLA